MPWVVGIDEAGYGPTLGPLVVGATLWHVPERRLDADYWKLLSSCVSRTSRGWRLALDDSKRAFDRKKGIGSLERTVLAFAAAAGQTCDTLSGLLRAVGGTEQPVPAAPWYAELNAPLPLDPAAAAGDGVRERLARTCAAAQLSFCGFLAEVVTEDRYNQRLAATHNKADVLLEHVLRLALRADEAAARLGRRAPNEPIVPDERRVLWIDRLGGRDEYRQALMTAFPERQMHELEVSAQRSAYQLAPRAGSGAPCWQIEFLVDGDQSRLPIALASMLAKYLREALMERFNRFWRSWIPDLRPTAGYYSDAQRFLADIHPVIAKAGVPHAAFVRAR